MNIVLGVSGSVAAYRAADLARELMRNGHTVRVCLTDSAQKFVTAALFEALTGQPCLTDTFEEPVVGRMAHIDWAREADLILIAPATANTLNKIAAGIADDMLTTIAVATTKPLMVAPAMNPQMYLNDHTQKALDTLAGLGVTIIEPAEGDVACGENGQGKLASIATIVAAVQAEIIHSDRLKGKHVLITSGPTQEPIDSVRFLTNRSSGKMGSALALAAMRMGANVTVIAGPQSAPVPRGAQVVHVKTALEMHDAVLDIAASAHIIIGAAAVADYRIENPLEGKIRRSEDSLSLNLVPNPDIIAAAAKASPGAFVVAFAAEPDPDLETARAKMTRKGVRMIAVNDVSRADIGFDSDQNQLTLLLASGETKQGEKGSKLQVAGWLLGQIESELKN